MTHQASSPISASLRIDQLRLTNYRCFADLAISFDPGLTVLVANNGQGKTAVLDAIATALGPFVGRSMMARIARSSETTSGCSGRATATGWNWPTAA